jgi:hypothetical protein
MDSALCFCALVCTLLILLALLLPFLLPCLTQAVVQALELHGIYHCVLARQHACCSYSSSLSFLLLRDAGCGASPRAAWR